MKNPEPDKGSFFPAQEIGMITYSLENYLSFADSLFLKCLKLEKVKKKSLCRYIPVFGIVNAKITLPVFSINYP